MRSIYKKRAWLIDDGIVLSGYTSKHKFFPDSFGCGFSYQKFRKKDIGNIVFYDETSALKKI
jgi:hypothetical protein